MKSRILLLIKIFDKEEHADAFIQKGELFCRTLGYFKKIDDDVGRGDKYEAVIGWHQPDQIKLTLSYKDKDGDEITFPIDDLAGPLILQYNAYDKLNMYCMYAVSIPEFEENYETEEERVAVLEKINAMLKEKSTLSDDFLSLGEFAVVVYQVKDFIDRVNNVAEEQSHVCWNGSVQYYDPDSFHGDFKEIEAVFRKRNIYQHQNEYRFVFWSPDPEGDKVFLLGSLSGIAIKVPVKEINETFQLKLAE